MEFIEFWRRVERAHRVQTYFLIWWLPFSMGVLLLMAETLERIPQWAFFVLFWAWPVVGMLLALRLTCLVCPQCGKRAFAHPRFRLSDAVCTHCGLRRSESSSRPS